MINKVEMMLSKGSNQTSATSKQEAKVTDSSKPSQKDCTCTSITNLQATCNKHLSSLIHQNENTETFKATDDLVNSHRCKTLMVWS